MTDLTHLIGDDYVQVDNGRPARVVAIVNNPLYPVVSVTTGSDGREYVVTLDTDLQEFISSPGVRIKRKPKTHTSKFKVLLERAGVILFNPNEYDTIEHFVDDSTLAVKDIEVTFMDGEGL